MKKLSFSLLAGFIFGLLDVLLMVPLKMPDKSLAMLGSFINRFAIGFIIVLIDLPMPFWKKGLIVGLLLSLPDAIITKTFLPIIGIGAVGGLVIGLIADKRLKSPKI